MKLEHACTYDAHKLQREFYSHGDINHTFQIYNFELLVDSINAISFKVALKLLNIELDVMEVLFESNLHNVLIQMEQQSLLFWGQVAVV